MAIIIAAFLFSSKKSINPKVKIYAFVAYIGACIFLGMYGILNKDIWIVIQNVVLFFVNLWGIRNARRELRHEISERSCITCKFRENGYLCENDEVVCGDKNKGWKPRTE